MATRRRKIALGVMALVAAALALTVCAKQRLTRLRLDYGPAQVSERTDIVYVTGSDDPKHRLDVYMPADAESVPVVHFIHGGYWVSGDKDYYRVATGLYGSVGMALAKRGVGAVVQSYRLTPDVDIDTVLDDVISGLAWTRAHIEEHGGDPDRVFLMGHSAGGHLVALLGSNDELLKRRNISPAEVRGYIALSAVWDIVDMHATQGEAFNNEVTFPAFGKDSSIYPSYSPVTHIHGSMRPFLIVAGESDYPYLIPQAERAAEQMRAVGNTPRHEQAPGNDHMDMVLRFGATNDNLSPLVVQFVTEHGDNG